MIEITENFEASAVSKWPELFFGLVGAVGTDLEHVVVELKSQLVEVGYRPIEIRLSKLIAGLEKFGHLDSLQNGPEDKRIDQHMEAGNEVRRLLKRGDGVSLLAIAEIRKIRYQTSGKSNEPLPRTAFIFNSLKHPEEEKTLRKLYGNSFFLISTYQPRVLRITRLTEKIKKSRRKILARKTTKKEKDEFKVSAEALVDKDQKEVGDQFGQNVRDVFPLADFFISDAKISTTSLNLDKQIRRFVRLLFGSRFTTPTIDEYGIFHATSSALRSSDVSRQVGAVILMQAGEIIAAGCNEVPQAGGGAFWEDSTVFKNDYREYHLEQTASAEMKHEMILEIFSALKNAGWLSKEISNLEPEEMTNKALYEEQDSVLGDAQVTDIIEFGRQVHAEMFALMDAVRRGISVKDATMYCTTFPCHMCARHIIASGIKRVVYIEPYPKSKAKELYEKTIQVDGDDVADDDAVKFEPFVGISPRQYLNLFEMLSRKDRSGFVIPINHIDEEPRLKTRFPIYFEFEAGYVESLADSGLVESDESA